MTGLLFSVVTMLMAFTLSPNPLTTATRLPEFRMSHIADHIVTVSRHQPADVIWSRGGGSFRRLVWKELCEHFVFWMVLFWVTFLLAVGFPPTQRESLSAVWLHAAPSLFALGFGALAFAREFESGTWDLLRAIGVSSRDVWRSKLLVGGVGSLVLSMQGVLLSLTWRSPYFIRELGLTTVAYLEVTLLTLLVAMLISLHTRRVLTAIVVSAAVLLPVWNLWVEVVEFCELVVLTPWRFVYGLVLAVVAALMVGLWLWQTSLVRRRLNCSAELIDSRRWWSVFRRMVWKESRMALDFWLAVVLITAVFAGLCRLSLNNLATRDQVIAVLGIIFPILHSLGCGGIAFALEREDATQDWLRRMAAPASAVFAAKLLVTQVSILSLTSLVLFGTQRLVTTAEGLLGIGAIAWVLMIVSHNGAISLAASLGTRRVLPAVFLAFVLCVIADVLLLYLFGDNFFWRRPGQLNATAVVPMWLVLIGLTVMIGLWQSDRWLNERPWWQLRRRTEPLATNAPNRTLFEQSPIPDRRAFGRLLWREWMEAKVWLWALPLTIAPAFTAELGRMNPGQPSGLLIMAFATSGIATLMLIVTPTLLGVWSFHHDRRHELLRFLSHRGSSPSSIWWSKQAVWLTLLAAGTSLAVPLWAMQLRYSGDWGFVFAGLASICVVQSFAAGQWVSQLVRSPLNAMFLAAVLSMLLAGWTGVLSHVRAAWLWHLAAPAIFFVASRLRSCDWLEERWSWRAWTRTLLSVVLPAIATWLILESLSYPISRTIRDWVLPR